jgi:anti-sigma B factor antagonist
MQQAQDNYPVIIPSHAPEGSVVTLRGEIDLACAEELKQAILAVAMSSPCRVVIDLMDCTFMDSTGLNAISDAHDIVPECQIVLRHPIPWIRKILVLTHMESCCSFDSPTEEIAPRAAVGTSIFEIAVRGRLSSVLIAAIGFDSSRFEKGTTYLVGQNVDQERLHGVFKLMQDLAMELVAVNELPTA